MCSMLEILKLKSNKLTKDIKIGVGEKEVNNVIKHYSPATQEWSSSAYFFNKNNVKFIPSASKAVANILYSYLCIKIKFSALNQEFKPAKKRMDQKIFISKPEFKFTNEKVTITLYTFSLTNEKFKTNKSKTNKNSKALNELKKSFLYSLKSIFIPEYNKHIDIVEKQCSNFINLTSNAKLASYYKLNSIKIYLKNALKTTSLMFLKKNILSNSKYSTKYTNSLNILLSKIFGKKVLINIVKLKKRFFNSDIFTQIVVKDMEKKDFTPLEVISKNLRFLNRVKPISKFTNYNNINDLKIEKTISLFNINNENKDVLNDFINKNFIEYKTEKPQNNCLKKDQNVLSSIKYKTINGARIEISGRLGRRTSSGRSVYRVKNMGSLKNIDASRGLPTTILRGNILPNIQYSSLSSTRRLGAFGVKGWIGSV